MNAPDTVFFLSDYGLRDTFVGVVHAVLRRLAPDITVVDLTHEIDPFDVRGGSLALAQAVPHLGPGVVLAVVDPGVGGGRRCVALRAPDGAEPQWLVGPDNGLLMPALDELGGVAAARAWQLPTNDADDGDHDHDHDRAVTFDGRDVLAPAVAAICRSEPEPGKAVDPQSLLRLPPPVFERDRSNGRVTLRAEVIALDRFGNVQLAVRRADLPAELVSLSQLPSMAPDNAVISVTLVARFEHPERASAPTTEARWVKTFGDLDQGELGLILDSSGHLALVMAEASAAAALCIATGDLVELTI